MTPQLLAGGPSSAPAQLTGVVETAGASGALSETVTLSALQTVSINSTNVLVTIPLVQQSMATANVTTAPGGSCSAGFDCVNFTLAVPGVDAFVGAFNSMGTQYSQNTGAIAYNVDGQPIPHADGTATCGQNDVQSAALTVSTGNSFPAGTVSFTGCN